eukprot:scaffold34210_cov49-Attheya_sp.AAC.1
MASKHPNKHRQQKQKRPGAVKRYANRSTCTVLENRACTVESSNHTRVERQGDLCSIVPYDMLVYVVQFSDCGKSDNL